MPAARNQSFENGSLGAFAVEMKHLRVELVRELDKLLFRYVEPLRFKAVARFQIVEIMLLHLKDARFIHDALLIIQQRVKCGRKFFERAGL
jgi:hypothetical protein